MESAQRDMVGGGPVALVTGGRRGIGRAAAIALARRGCRVAVTSHAGVDALAGTMVELYASAATDALALHLDLLSRPTIDAALETISRHWGSIDILVNNAIYQGPHSMTTIMELDPEALERVFLAQIVNTTYLVRQVLSERSEDREVRMVNVGSGAADYTPPAAVGAGGFAFSYAASKAALHRLAPLLNVELGDSRVYAFTFDPGVVRTEALLESLGEVPGAVDPEVPAKWICALALDPAAVRLAGHCIQVGEPGLFSEGAAAAEAAE